jgi:hypothetical protein
MLKAMRAVAVAIAIFALLAFDLTKNDGEWTGNATAFVGHLGHEFQLALGW